MVSHRRTGSCRRFAFANNKGGVGKTTLTARMAEELAARGHRVLVGDGDPQANSSRMLGYNEESLIGRPTINEVVLAARVGGAADAILPCTWDQIDDMPLEAYELAQRIDLLPSRWTYEDRVAEAVGHEAGSAMGRHARQRLAVALSGGVLDNYDFFLLDLPPSIGPLTRMGFDAIADVDSDDETGGVIIPLYPDYDPISGAVRVRDLIGAGATEWDRPRLRLAGVVINRYDPHRKRTQKRDFLANAQETFAGQIMGPTLHERSQLSEMGSMGWPLRSQPPHRIRDYVRDLGQLAELMEKGHHAA